jgi:RHS repeat-associated protein
MLDDVGLIHMNGRLYDPFLGRFCAADPYVQSPKNTQNYNRYTYVLNNPLSLVDPSGHFFGLIFGAIAAVATWIAGAVGAIFVAIGVILHAIGSLIIAAGKLLWAAVKFTLTAVKASAAWMKTVGTKLITSIKAGVGVAAQWMGSNPILAGAATNATWSGIQTARHGGSASDIWKSVARGAVIGAVSAVIGMGMHKMGTAFGSIAQGGNSVTGTLVHAAAHGVSGGAMTAANGGSFKDGFIGGAIGFGVGLPFGGAGGMIQGTDLGSIAARTTIAAIGGGVASRLSGGSFADGAYSAAFFHLFNSEATRVAGKQSTLDLSRRATNGAFNILGRLWSLPNTAIGLIYGLASLPFGGSFEIVSGVIQVTNMPKWLMNGAMSLGDVNLFGAGSPPESDNNVGLFRFEGGGQGVTTGQEERLHSIQGRIFGPLYLAAHGVGGVISLLTPGGHARFFGFDPWHRNNFMETGPMQGRVFFDPKIYPDYR